MSLSRAPRGTGGVCAAGSSAKRAGWRSTRRLTDPRPQNDILPRAAYTRHNATLVCLTARAKRYRCGVSTCACIVLPERYPGGLGSADQPLLTRAGERPRASTPSWPTTLATRGVLRVRRLGRERRSEPGAGARAG